ncbi:hypothetical protein ACHAW5_004807 [Stephanodiscus triporus]|uniref:Uncharacterized protein n=1 Tax=Stephanodiscus triporus TaxID=2934178 RepID=A0ABD3MNT1_9STRA
MTLIGHAPDVRGEVRRREGNIRSDHRFSFWGIRGPTADFVCDETNSPYLTGKWIAFKSFEKS